MIVVLYYTSFILLIPGAFIALFFLSVDRVATQGTLGQMLAGVWQALGWLYGGGFFALAIGLVAVASLVIFLVVGGALPRARPYAAGALLALAVASLVTVLRIGGMPKLEELVIPLCSTGSAVLSAIVLWQSAFALTRQAP